MVGENGTASNNFSEQEDKQNLKKRCKVVFKTLYCTKAREEVNSASLTESH